MEQNRTGKYVARAVQRNGQELLSWIQSCQAHSSAQAKAHAIALHVQISYSRNLTDMWFISNSKNVITLINMRKESSWDFKTDLDLDEKAVFLFIMKKLE